MKFLKTVFALAFVLALLTSACQPGQARGPVTIRVLSMEQAGPTVDEMNSIVQEFNKANPNIKVRDRVRLL